MVIDDKDFHPGLCDTRHKAVELPGRTSVILQERGTRRPYRFYPTDNILEAERARFRRALCVWAPSGSAPMLLRTSGNAQRHCKRLSRVGLLVDYLAFAVGVFGGGGT